MVLTLEGNLVVLYSLVLSEREIVITTMASQDYDCAQVEIRSRDGLEFKGVSEDHHVPKNRRLSFDFPLD